ncbi:hypothetical protein [Neorhizobium sp. T7_12]|uniref:hypothetical protein n=1 Tax=Neorhizobium sp. T7_12 TaxID=2093832 RepID=UPI00155ECFAE|nr:hypothetical protein [Neorhizobium sp. T7_12]
MKGILAAVCDECDAVVAIPAQSTPAIRRAREVAEVALEVSIPAPEVEILDAAASHRSDCYHALQENVVCILSSATSARRAENECPAPQLRSMAEVEGREGQAHNADNPHPQSSLVIQDLRQDR